MSKIGASYRPLAEVRATQLEMLRLNPLFTTGTVQRLPGIVAARGAEGGDTVTLPFWEEIPGVSAVATDNSATNLTPNEITGNAQRAIFRMRTHALQSNGAVKASNGDGLASVQAQYPMFWQREMSKDFISTLEGVRLDNIANDSGDMVEAAGVGATAAGQGAGGAPPVENLMTTELLIRGSYQMGERVGDLTTVVVHPTVAEGMAVAGVIRSVETGLPQGEGARDIPFQNQRILINETLGLQVVISRDCPALADGAGRTLFVSYLLAQGAFGHHEQPPENGLEEDRVPLGANGAGVDQLISRRLYFGHLQGTAWTGTTVTGRPVAGAINNTGQAFGPSNAELAVAANWDRVVGRELVPATFLLTNG